MQNFKREINKIVKKIGKMLPFPETDMRKKLIFILLTLMYSANIIAQKELTLIIFNPLLFRIRAFHYSRNNLFPVSIDFL